MTPYLLQHAPGEWRHLCYVKRATHAEEAEAAYKAGWRDGEQGFERGWSVGRCMCESCQRLYDRGFDDAVDRSR